MTGPFAERERSGAVGEGPGTDELPEILVCDDELGCREGMRRILVSRGYRVATAADGAQALEQSAQHPYPILLVDLKMPEVDGFEVIEQVRNRRPDTLCIVVSAFATIESAVRTTKMGAFDFVVKPFVPDDLMRVVQRATEKWRLTRVEERLKMEREAHLLELFSEKSRLRTIVQAMAEGLLVINVAGDVVLDNLCTRRLLGRVSASRLEGPVETVVPEERFCAQVRRLLGGTTEAVASEVELSLKIEERERFLRATLAPVRDRNDAVLGVVALLGDVTDAKALERAKLMFVTMVAHELKAPIGAVEGYLNLLESGSLDSDPERRTGVVKRCLERTAALLELIRDLSDMTRRDAGRRERRIEQIDVGRVCESLVEFHRLDAAKKRLEATVEVVPGSAAVAADRSDVEQVVTNLVSNAIKYNVEGGRIRVQVGPSGPLVKIEVVDTGVGMSPEEAARVGEEFFRAKNDRTRMVTGTGLGLALVKRIVESYNGTLAVESSPGRGSTFTVLLPAGPTAVPGDRLEGARDERGIEVA